jgi:trehalose 6-phosphate phosphatase
VKNILSSAGLRRLDQYARSNVLLAFDFDGTLAPIVSVPERARMRSPTARLMKELARLYPCAVLSGRAREDVRRRMAGVSLAAVVGNHGAEPTGGSRELLRTARRWQPILRRELAGLPGVRIENKAFSTSIHYRRSPEKARAKAAVLAAVDRLQGVRIVGGKLVVNVLPKGAPHKGLALERERRRLGCETAMYVGDDETDEDVFALSRPDRLLGVRVGRRSGSAARYFVPAQRDVDRLLKALIRSRRR